MIDERNKSTSICPIMFWIFSQTLIFPIYGHIYIHIFIIFYTREREYYDKY